MTYLLAFLVSALYIGLKAIQQRQVMAAEYRKMPAVSLGMAFCEVFIVANVARSADGVANLVLLALAIGLGSALGSILGTYIHVRKHP
jgi:ribose/xylose/arabinose/galactoside ABC-type transport system permease subunit